MREIIRSIVLSSIGMISKPKNGIYILNSHFADKNNSDEKRFDNLIQKLNKYVELIDIQHAINLIDNKVNPNKCFVALTFDDGYEEFNSIIMKVLNKYSIKAAFFINTSFIQSNEEYRREYSLIVKSKKKPMDWQQVVELSKNGHIVGSHLADHLDITKLKKVEKEYQLSESKYLIEKYTNSKCEYFAYPFGGEKYIDNESIKIISKYYKYIFSSYNNKYYMSYNNLIYNRRHIEIYWPKEHIKYFLSKKRKYDK